MRFGWNLKGSGKTNRKVIEMKWLNEKVLIALIGLLSTGAAGLYHLVDAKNRAEVELQLRKEYDKTINDYAADLADCR